MTYHTKNIDFAIGPKGDDLIESLLIINIINSFEKIKGMKNFMLKAKM